MPKFDTNVQELKYKVLREVARLAKEDKLREELLSIPETIIPYTPHTILDRGEIMEELWKTRRRGYAIDNCERENRVRCVGVPVYSAGGALVAGISTSGPVDVMTDEKVLLCAKLLSDTALRMRERIYH